MVNASYLDEIPKVKQAFSDADQVTVEMVLDSSKLEALAMMALMPDKKLSTMISKEDYDLVAEEFKAVMGADLAMFEQLKPVTLSVLLTLMYIRQDQGDILGKYTGAPLDIHFASEGKRTGKKVNTFETMEEQMRILYDGETPEKQAEHLVAFVKAKDEMKASQKQLTDDYFEGDLNAMYALSEKYADEMGDLTYMLDDRNVRWMELLPGLLKDGGQFVAVGALHLTGKKSLITMLRAAGYTVKPLALK
ncbi:MAG: TraB/GumN family protein [Bacteroidia bacterium]|nr:TraB/GumN family protein [Bacteroidia bacterium]